jgi:hypothetical protein
MVWCAVNVEGSNLLTTPRPPPFITEVLNRSPVRVVPAMVDWGFHDAQLLPKTLGAKVLPGFPIVNILTARRVLRRDHVQVIPKATKETPWQRGIERLTLH